jgi:hypothetical protein
LCNFGGCDKGILTHGTDYQYLTMTPYYDGVQAFYGIKGLIKTTAKFTGKPNSLFSLI